MATATADVSLLRRLSGGARPKQKNTNVLECRVCEDIFSLQGDKVPRLLLCGHTLCHECLSRLTIQGRAVLCPFDRQPTDLSDSGVWGLKKNFALLELLERLQVSRDAASNSGDASFAGENPGDSGVPCDENESHAAEIYCTVCSTNLCRRCAQSTHATRTLAKHRQVPLSERPKERATCSDHAPHLVEFACQEPGCRAMPLMCFVCKDYGKHRGHKHTLLDQEAESTRGLVIGVVQQVRNLSEEMSESARRLSDIIQQIEGGLDIVEDLDGVAEPRHVPGTAEMARTKVRTYFADLHETLLRQEEVAASVLDTHIRERLHLLRQQQEHCALMMSSISAMSYNCQAMVNQDDAKLVVCKQDVTSLQEALQAHKQQFTEITEHIQLDANVPVTFTKDNRVHIGPKMEMRVVVLGLDNAGKTTILFKLKQNEFIQTIRTIGFNVETVEYKNLNFTIWDVGGDTKLRPLWKHYYLNTQALIFVVDSTDGDRLDEAYDELAILMSEKQLRDALLLVFANKQDQPNALNLDTISDRLSLNKLCCGRSWFLQPCDALSGAGLWDGLEWLSAQLVAAGVMDLA